MEILLYYHTPIGVHFRYPTKALSGGDVGSPRGQHCVTQESFGHPLKESRSPSRVTKFGHLVGSSHQTLVIQGNWLLVFAFTKNLQNLSAPAVFKSMGFEVMALQLIAILLYIFFKLQCCLCHPSKKGLKNVVFSF